MKELLKEKLGSNITVLDILYYQQYKYKNEYSKDLCMIIYKDEKGKKKISTITNPDVDIYFTKPEYAHEWTQPREQVDINKTYTVTCPYRNIVSTIAKEMKKYDDKNTRLYRDLYHRAWETRDYRSMKEIFKWQHTFMSDLPLEDYYRIKMAVDYNMDFEHKINRAFLDIESDIYGVSTELNEDRTSLVNIIFDPIGDETKPQMHTFILKDYDKFTQQKEVIENLEKFKELCHDEFDLIKIKQGKKKIDIENIIDYHFHIYDNDGDMITALFNLINTRRPDTIGVWNLAYDYPKLYNRLLENGLNPVDIMSDKAFPSEVRFVDMNIDNRPGVEPADKKTFIRMTSTSKPYCQMNLYASTRKGGKEIGSVALDNVVKNVLGLKKREFDGIGTNVTNAAIREYSNFLLYGINDVVLQYVLDNVTFDTTAYIYDSNTAGSAMENTFKQTRYLKTIYYIDDMKKGFVRGNNINIDYIKGIDENISEMIEELKNKKKIDEYGEEYEDEEEDVNNTEEDEIISYYEDSPNRVISAKGGLVGDPSLKTANGEELIEGVPSQHVFFYVVDMDYSAQYPRAKISRNIGRTTQYGRLIIRKKISNRQNEYKDPNYLPGGEFVSDYVSQDYISMGNVWFNLPNIDELLDIVDDTF